MTTKSIHRAARTTTAAKTNAAATKATKATRAPRAAKASKARKADTFKTNGANGATAVQGGAKHVPQRSIEQRAVDTVRMLTVDSVQKANSGHPGTPMGLAPMGVTLFTKVMQHNPNDPSWPNRDRFVMSGGHGSLLQYSLLHLTGYDLPLEEFKHFRQLGSLTPGHPKRGLTPGIEMSTGPLGQGLANGVGLAIAEKLMATRFNEPGFDVIDHHTWIEAGDGDIMEGLSSESAAVAGQLGLEKLTVIYDANKVSADGTTDKTLDKEDVGKRFKAFGWRVLEVADANDMTALEKAMVKAKKLDGRPTMIIVHSQIAAGGASKAGDPSTHGKPLGEEAIAEMRQQVGWETDEPFFVPDEVKQYTDQRAKGAAAEARWDETMQAYAKAFPEKAKELQRELSGKLPAEWDANMPTFKDGEMLSTEVASGQVIQQLAKNIPEFVAGSADLGDSTFSDIKGSEPLSSDDFTGRNIPFGVREQAMTAALNGIVGHGGVRSFVSTYLSFGTDYGKEGIRMAAQMHLPAIYHFGHDSFHMGQDGASHHSVEQLVSLRAMPNVHVIRPADARETVGAWRSAEKREDGPTVMVFTKQAVPVLAGSDPAKVMKGAYVLEDRPKPQVVIIGTGSEVSLASEAAKLLEKRGVSARVVSMPSWELFRDQGKKYQQEVLPPGTPVLSVEAGSPMGWAEWSDAQISIDHYGDSATDADLTKAYGFTPEKVAAAAQKLLKKS